MGELSIKIKIFDREYPMKVKPEDEEKIRTACKTINDMLKGYATRFKIDDKQDLLAMLAFDSLVEKLTAEKFISGKSEFLSDKLSELNGLLDKSLG